MRSEMPLLDISPGFPFLSLALSPYPLIACSFLSTGLNQSPARRAWDARASIRLAGERAAVGSIASVVSHAAHSAHRSFAISPLLDFISAGGYG